MIIRFYLSTTIFAFIFFLTISACSNRYAGVTTVTSTSKYPGVLERARKDQRYFILHSGINLYTVTSLDLDRAKQQMTVTLDKVDSTHLLNFKNFQAMGHKPEKVEANGTSEIYVFMNDSTSYTLDEPHTIPLKNVGKVELLD
jgi:hypothetical protein